MTNVIGEEKMDLIFFQTHKVFGYDMSIATTVLSVFCMVLFILILRIIVISICGKKDIKKAELYVEQMTSIIKERKNLKESLIQVAEKYSEKSKERKIINEAIHYLEHSILKDHYSALEIISSYFDDSKVDELHKRILGGEFYDKRISSDTKNPALCACCSRDHYFYVEYYRANCTKHQRRKISNSRNPG